jgi:hypothetical protein
MSIFYKNQGFNLTTTVNTTVLTIDAQSRALVKNVAITNYSAQHIDVTAYVYDSSATSSYEFFNGEIPPDCTVNAAGTLLILEESDAIKIQAETSTSIQGVISYALLNRSQENG